MYNLHRITRLQHAAQGKHVLTINKKKHMPAQAILLINHAKTNAGKLPLQVIQQHCNPREQAREKNVGAGSLQHQFDAPVLCAPGFVGIIGHGRVAGHASGG